MTHNRKQRLLRILELISTRRIHTQEELVEALATDGWDVTQSSVSRDIAALGLVKVDGVYHRPLPDAMQGVDPDELRIREGVLSVEAAGDVLVVIRTPAGEANRVAAALDRLRWSSVIGTIAGDDTLFIATKDRAAQRALIVKVRALAGTGA